MPDLNAIKTRLTAGVKNATFPVIRDAYAVLQQQDFRAQFSAQQVQQWCERYQLTPVQLALQLLPLAACYARVPVSHFYVGAVAIGQSGAFYFGANQEFADQAIQQSVHAEQSAISHAWTAGERGLTDMVVNYTPCGHCRQFMNELNSAAQLHIHLPHSQNNLLHSYLPDAFGPKDLDIHRVLFDPQDHGLHTTAADPVVQAAITAANSAYAPYSLAASAVALALDDRIITGRYIENAAFNPSFLPLQNVLNYQRLQGLSDRAVKRVVMAEKQAVLSHRHITAALAESVLNLPLEYLACE